MSKIIYKYPLNEIGNTFEMPKGSKILTCQLQGNIPTIWALVDLLEETEKRHFEAIGTGHEINEHSEHFQYINTVQLPNGIVLHIFEITS